MSDMIIRDSSFGTVNLIEKLIKDRNLEHLQNTKSFEEGLMIGIEAGIHYSNIIKSINSRENIENKDDV